MARVYHGLGQVPKDFAACALTIGNFDGVHRGHRRILEHVVGRARADGRAAAALTFDPHPLAVIAPERAPAMLMTIEQRMAAIEKIGIESIVVLPFTAELSRFAPREFVERILVDRLRAKHVTVGNDFRFGRRHAGNVGLLKELGAQFGFEADTVPTVIVGGAPVSSTRVRESVEAGEIQAVRTLLGRRFSLVGPIVKGEGIGSRQTVPTLNLAPRTAVIPADGVYVTLTSETGSDRCRESITNIGQRPTFGGSERTIETHLLGQVAVKTPESIELWFLRRIRDEKKFASADRLKARIQADVREAERYFRRIRALGRTTVAVS